MTEFARLLKPGGRLGLSDVTFLPDALPPALDFPLARALCIPLATGPDEYTQAIVASGLEVEHVMDCSETILPLLEEARSKLGLVALVAKHALSVAEGDASEEIGRLAEEAVAAAEELVQAGELGYWAFVARKAPE